MCLQEAHCSSCKLCLQIGGCVSPTVLHQNLVYLCEASASVSLDCGAIRSKEHISEDYEATAGRCPS